MPESANEHLDWLKQFIQTNLPASILDVGMGRGNYGWFLRNEVGYQGTLTGIEIWEPYLSDDFAGGNKTYYNDIILADVRDALRDDRICFTEMTFAFDIIEHFERHEGINILRNLQGRCNDLLVCVPIVHYEQGALYGNPHETHRCQWKIEEMIALGGELVGKGACTGLFRFRKQDFVFPFSKAFVLTIRKAKDACLETLSHLASLGIPAEAFLGIDGRIAGLVPTHTYEVDAPGSGYRIGPITVALYLGHYMMWQLASHLEGDSFLFMEDDVRFRPDWQQRFTEILPYLPPTWDVIYPGPCCIADKPKTLIHGSLYRINYALCTHAYAIRKKALPMFLKKLEKVWAPVDIGMALECLPDLETYAFYPRLADQAVHTFPD